MAIPPGSSWPVPPCRPLFAPEPPPIVIQDDFEAPAQSAGGAYVPEGAVASMKVIRS